MVYPNRKWIFMGEPGVGKTSLAVMFPKPILSFHFDNPDKCDEPYERLGDYTIDPKTGIYLRPNPGILGPMVTDEGGRYRWVTSRKSNKKIILIRFYKDLDPRDPREWVEFQNYHANLVRDLYKSDRTLRWQSIIYDSVGGMELLARKDQQYRLNPDTKEPRQWSAGSTSDLEEFLQSSVPALPCNAIVITHIDHREDPVHGGFLHMPVAPGRLRINLFRDYSEMYRIYVHKDEDGKIQRKLQTIANGEFHAFTQIGAPDGGKPSYQNLWVNWAKTHGGGEKTEEQAVS